MKYTHKIGGMLTASFLLATASCSDYSDYNSVPEAGNTPEANATLWENIASDSELTKFTALAQKSNFSNVLSSPRFYTLWAPIDGAISQEEYDRLMASDSATIVKEFMHQHMTEYNLRVSSALDNTTIVSLNDKHHQFEQTGFDGHTYRATNIPSLNGVMHKINGQSVYHPNLFENVSLLENCNSIKEYIQKYDELYLDLAASVPGPLRDGKQTYLDSVMKTRNVVIESMMNAKLSNEDSTYCMLIPNDDAWKEAYDKAAGNYKYIEKMDYLDLSKKTQTAEGMKGMPTHGKADKAAEVSSLNTSDRELTPEKAQDSITCKQMVTNLVFSQSSDRNKALFEDTSFDINDSAYSTRRNYLTNMQEVLNHTVSINSMSNGMARTLDQLPFLPWETYQKPVVVKTVSKYYEVKGLTRYNIPLEDLAGRDTLFSKIHEQYGTMFDRWLFPSDSRFFSYIAVDSANVQGESGCPEFNFALPNVCSTTYHIYVIVVPEQVSRPEAAVKPYYLRFYLSWTDDENTQHYEILPKNANKSLEITTAQGTSTNKVIYVGDPGRLNVIDLGEFTFPATYYALDAYPSLMMMHTKSYSRETNRKRYDQQMRIAGVFLLPTEYVNSFNE